MLPISFSLTGVTTSKIIADVQANIKKERMHLIYTATVEPEQVPVAYIGMPSVSAESINIRNIDSILENGVGSNQPRSFRDRQFTIPTRSALITDIATSFNIPLFYKHVIADGLRGSVELLDINLNPANQKDYRLLVENGLPVVYHNLTPIIRSEQILSAYYLRYINTSGIPKVELLSPSRVFTQATIDQPQQSKSYVIREAAGGYEYRILGNATGPFYVKTQDTDQIKLIPPKKVYSNRPWYLKITDGEVVKPQPARTAYSITEYHLQDFSPIEPIKYSGTVEAVVSGSSLVLLPHENIILDDVYGIEILLTTENLKPIIGWGDGEFWIGPLAIHNTETETIRFPLQSYTDSGISLDKESGIISLPVELKLNTRVFARFSYIEKAYEYRELNINPAQNKTLVDKKIVIYCIPTDQIDDTLQSIFHLILDEEHNIEEWNDPRLGIDELNESLLADEEETSYEKFLSEYPDRLIIGYVYLSRDVGIDDIVFLDIRKHGIGLTEEANKNIVSLSQEYPELQWFTDSSISERPLPLQMASHIEVPFELLERAGGQFSEEAIEASIKKHMALGSHVVLDYVASKPHILNCSYNSETETLFIKWAHAHSNKYRIYYSTSLKQNFRYISIENTEDEIYSESISISVGDASSLYVYVSPVVNEVEWPRSDIMLLDLVSPGHALELEIGAIISSPPSIEINVGAIIVNG